MFLKIRLCCSMHKDRLPFELLTIRRKLGLNQAEFAAQVGITRTYLGLLERGQKPITPRVWAAAKSARPKPLTFIATHVDPVLRSLETAMIENGLKFKLDYISEEQRFDFFLPDLSLGIIVARDRSAEAKPTHEIRNVISLTGKQTIQIFTDLLSGRPLNQSREVLALLSFGKSKTD
jgi:transcriptional regulator with XRE-family HTH domain